MAIIPWKTLDSRYLIRDPWMVLRADRCETERGVTVDPFYVQEPPDWVQIVAFDRDDRILLVQQYRHGAGVVSRELPCGKIEAGEDPAEAARRELLEETGCVAQTLLPLPALSPNLTSLANTLYAFVALNTECVEEQHLDATEEIEFGFATIPEVLALIEGGGFLQALHVAYLFLALQKRGLYGVSPVARDSGESAG